MRAYWTPVGMIDPLVAVAGDIGMALLVAFGLILPVSLAWRRLTRPLERRGWQRTLARMDQGQSRGLVGRFFGGWLTGRLRFARRLGQMRLLAAGGPAWGLQAGLPVTAVFIAINPIWGDNNYFFNTETWATGVWHRWAAARTDTWRENMIVAVRGHYKDVGGRPPLPCRTAGGFRRERFQLSRARQTTAKAVPPSIPCATSTFLSANGRT